MNNIINVYINDNIYIKLQKQFIFIWLKIINKTSTIVLIVIEK